MKLRKKTDNNPLLNENIPYPIILLIKTNEEKEIISREEALNISKKLNLDILCVSPNNNPPVCKLVDYQKIQFLQKKQKKKKDLGMKELRISFNIGENDLKIKLQKAEQWIEKNFSVKFTLTKIRNNTADLAVQKCDNIINFFEEKIPIIIIKKIHREWKNFSFTLLKNKKKEKSQKINIEPKEI